MDVHLLSLAASQLDLVARWQLLAAGWSAREVDDRAWRHGWRAVHDGVYVLTHAPLRREQRWLAACLTAPGTMLAGASAAACWGLRDRDPAVVSVVRAGSGGPRQLGGVDVRRARLLGDDIDWNGGIPVTSAERTLIDLAPHLAADALAKATREGIRRKLLTARSLGAAVSRHRGRRGTRRLRAIADRYAAT